MKFSFKRALSSAMALVMMLSCVTFMSTNAMAAGLLITATEANATSQVKAISSDSASYLYTYTMPNVSGEAETDITASDKTHNAHIKLKGDNKTVSFSIKNVAQVGEKISSKASNDYIEGISKNQTVVLDVYVNSDNDCALSFNKNSSAKNSTEKVTLTGRTAYQVSVEVDEDTDKLYFHNDQQLAIQYIGVKETVAVDRYAVSGTVTGGVVDLAGRTFSVKSNGESVAATATIGEGGTTFTVSPNLEAGTYTFEADWGDYTLTSDGVTVTNAAVTNAVVSVTKVKTNKIVGKIEGKQLEAGSTFKFTNTKYKDITATATVGQDGVSFTTDKDLVDGDYNIDLKVEGYNVPSIVKVSGENVTITLSEMSYTSKTYVWDLSKGLTKGDNGNGLYALENMNVQNDGTIQGLENPSYTTGKIPTGPNGSEEGAILKLMAKTAGQWKITWKTGSGKTVYGVKETGPDATTEIYKHATTADEEDTYVFNVDANETYYFFGTGTKLKYSAISFVTTEQPKFTYKEAITKGNDVYVIGQIAGTDTADVDEIGFGIAAKSASGVFDPANAGISQDTVFKSIVDGDVSVAAETSGMLFAAIKVTGAAGKDLYVSTYSKSTDGNIVYSEADNRKASN